MFLCECLEVLTFRHSLFVFECFWATHTMPNILVQSGMKREKSVKNGANEGEKMQILRKILVTSPPINEFNPTEYDEKKLFNDILPTDMWRITCTTPQ